MDHPPVDKLQDLKLSCIDDNKIMTMNGIAFANLPLIVRFSQFKTKIHFDGEYQGTVHQLVKQGEKYLARQTGLAPIIQNKCLSNFLIELQDAVYWILELS